MVVGQKVHDVRKGRRDPATTLVEVFAERLRSVRGRVGGCAILHLVALLQQ